MVIKISLRYWSIERSPLMKMPTTTIPCGQGVLKGREMIETPKYVMNRVDKKKTFSLLVLYEMKNHVFQQFKEQLKDNTSHH